MSELSDRLRRLGDTMSGSSGGYLCCECADELDRLTRERDEAMRWTKERPTKPGLWWRRYGSDTKGQVRLIDLNGSLYNAETRRPVDAMEGFDWSDRPIPEPEK